MPKAIRIYENGGPDVAAPAFAPQELAKRGSLFFTRAGGGDYLNTAAARQSGARELFSLIKRKLIRVHVGQRFALADAASPHRELEARHTIGSSILVP